MKGWLLVFFILFFLMSGFLWQGIYLPIAPASEKEVLFQIKRGQGSKEIALNLEKEGLITRGSLFRVYVLGKGFSKKLQAGTYLVSPSMNIPKIAEKFITGDVAKIKVTIPEGFTIKQIQDKLNQFFNMAKQDLFALTVGALEGNPRFLSDAPKAANLEGYLFPDTYHFFYEDNAEEIVRKMLNNFDQKFTEDLRKEIKAQNKTIFEIVTMASLLEKEVKTKEDKELVSGVLWKRLKQGIPLQVDATIVFITGKQDIKVSQKETQIDSPYNTYKYRGLPVGPISNPGLESLKAAVYPKDSQYWYYLSTPAASKEASLAPSGREGKTIFSKTLEEHNSAKTQYLK